MNGNEDTKTPEATQDVRDPRGPSVDAQRREITTRGLAAAGSALLGLAALACSDGRSAGGAAATDGGSADEDGGDSAARPDASGGPDSGPRDGGGEISREDLDQLNALLAAEYVAVTAYGAGAELIDSAPAADPLSALRETLAGVAGSFRAQHREHAAVLRTTIEDLGGTPVTEQDAGAGFEAPQGLLANPSIANVLRFAAGAERDAAIAYNQVISGLSSAPLRFLAGSIEGDETQHFIVLAALVLGLAAPGPNLSAERAEQVVPSAFVSPVEGRQGLSDQVADYFA